MLGQLTWAKVYESWTWSFTVPLGDGSAVDASTLPDADWDPLSQESLDRIRTIVARLRANEPSLRARVAADMLAAWRLDWWDPQQDGEATPECLANRLKLVEITFIPDGLAYLVYHFDSSSGPGIIRLGLNSAGEVAITPSFPW